MSSIPAATQCADVSPRRRAAAPWLFSSRPMKRLKRFPFSLLTIFLLVAIAALSAHVAMMEPLAQWQARRNQ